MLNHDHTLMLVFVPQPTLILHDNKRLDFIHSQKKEILLGPPPPLFQTKIFLYLSSQILLFHVKLPL